MRDHDYKFKPSFYFFVLAAIFLLLNSILVGFFISVAVWLKLLLLTGLYIYVAIVLWRFIFFKSPNAIIAIKYQGNGAWLIETKQRQYIATLRGDSILTDYLAILRFQEENRFFACSSLVFPDSLPSDRYRQLLVMLKMG